LAGSGRTVGFLGAYAAVWLAFGLVAFVGDVGVHGTVHATPWLMERPWLISVGVPAIAGIYQFTPAKHRAIDACRHPIGPNHGGSGLEAGRRHATDCLRSSWALMLVMFAAGFAGLAWMIALTGVMAYEGLGRQGHRVAILVGIAMLVLSAVASFAALTTPGVPVALL
jgi:predicted metal-binding membrane protein